MRGNEAKKDAFHYAFIQAPFVVVLPVGRPPWPSCFIVHEVLGQRLVAAGDLLLEQKISDRIGISWEVGGDTRDLRALRIEIGGHQQMVPEGSIFRLILFEILRIERELRINDECRQNEADEGAR